MAALETEIVNCRACPRLVEWRERVGREKRAAFAGEEYWARPVPGFGDLNARLWLVGLAPAAHGGNRTGRIFTGDRSGDWLYAALYRVGLANQPQSVALEDGLELRGAFLSAGVRCAPPANKPTIEERRECSRYLLQEMELLHDVKVMLALGRFAYDALAAVLGLRRRPSFGHGVELELADGRAVVCSYHPSQQNTFTGKLTEGMLDSVLERCLQIAG